jgi:hypothetical protein
VTGRLPELLAALDAVRRRIYYLRASLEEAEHTRARIVDELLVAEAELEGFRALLRAAGAAAPPTRTTTRRRREERDTDAA